MDLESRERCVHGFRKEREIKMDLDSREIQTDLEMGERYI